VTPSTPAAGAAILRPMVQRGAYTADRAAALSGVPWSTVHYWARKGYLVPSVSASRVKLWSYQDLMGLRIIDWLRRTKDAGDDRAIPRTSMRAIKLALKTLREELDLDLWTEDGGPTVAVDRAGRMIFTPRGAPMAADLQHVLGPGVVDILEPFPTLEGTQGPDLRTPRPRLRIVPGKLAGSPHIERTRVETIALGALAHRGLDIGKVYSLYPTVDPKAIDEAIDLENQLARNLAVAA
jgi:uncharacterized protein (DUF433 family)